MNNKEYVQLRYPKAQAERQKGNDGRVYWLIRNGRQTMYMASGDTEAKAWKEAKESVLDHPIHVPVYGGKLIVKSSIPSLHVTIWNGQMEIVVENIVPGGGAGVIPYFKTGNEPVQETVGELMIPLPKGLYAVRFSLPYRNSDGSLFPMPVMMDKHITIYDDSVVTLEFNPKLQETVKRN